MKTCFLFPICHHLHLFHHPQITLQIVLANLMMLHIRLCYCLTTVQVPVAEPALSSWMRPPRRLLPPTSIAAWDMQRRRVPRRPPRHPPMGRCPAHHHLPRCRLVQAGRRRLPVRRPRGRLLLGRPSPLDRRPPVRRRRPLRVPTGPCHPRQHRHLHHHRCLRLPCVHIHAVAAGFIAPRSAPMALLHGLPLALLKRKRTRLLNHDTIRLL
jgi:hypothetical protein